MFHENQQIGQYTLIRKLGKGGFGEVWLAEKRSQFVTKRVAVKLPLDEQVNFEAIRQEATLWEQASGHANVLPIIDADVYDGQVVIVSEYADGGSLHDKLKTEGKLPLKQAVEMTIGILNGLEFLHNKRIIHRDIKPQNILLQGETPRLADFGISRAMQTTAISSTIIGTDAYMSPESFTGNRNAQTDIWSVGVVLYQLIKGFLPFPQEHPSERMYAILQEDFESLPANVPRSLKTIITKALSKLPENRYQTATEMRDDLRRALRGESISAQENFVKEGVVIPQNIPKKIILPKASPETETVVKPRISPEITKTSIPPKSNKDIKEQNVSSKTLSFVESKTPKKVEPKYSPLRTFVKPFVVAVILVGVFAGILSLVEFNKNSGTTTLPRANTGNTTPSATPQQTVTIPCKGRIYNPSGNVKVRSFPGLSKDNTIVELNDGSLIYVHEFSSNSKWVRISTIGGFEGWIGSLYFICE